MESKKGVSTIVSWVLLLGLTIGLATTVFFWTTRQAEEMTEHTVRFVEGGMLCENVMIDVAKSPADTCKLTVTNIRYLNIEKVILRSMGSADSTDCYGGSQLKVKESVICEEPLIKGWSGKIEVLPIIKVNGNLAVCKNKAVTVECPPVGPEAGLCIIGLSEIDSCIL